jgi:hypothetical protein
LDRGKKYGRAPKKERIPGGGVEKKGNIKERVGEGINQGG